MPSTVNGIGTHYYGKKNLQTRPGPCPHCGNSVELKSYDTRLWFVIFFVPIFPLKRLHIIDYCSRCTRHYMMEQDKWDSAQQLEISGAQDKFRSNPTPEAAMEVHQQLMNFHQLEDAAAFRQLMREKFPDNAKIHAYLGASLERFGKRDEATEAYQRAFELRPDLPEARIGVARGHIVAGKLVDARRLLDFMEKPGAAQLYSLEPIDTLARAFQAAGQHEEALALFAVIQRELPQFNEQVWFRNLIQKSEKALHRRESQLPHQPFSLKRFFGPGNASTARTAVVFSILLGLVALGFVISNEFIRRHRKLYFVNGYPETAMVRINGGEALLVRQSAEMNLAEGSYVATITGPVQEEVPFTIKESYWSRWFSDPAWVVNVGGSAILEFSQVTYARNDPPPPDYSFHFGERFQRFADVSHPFEELPEKVSVKSGQSKTLTHLDVFTYEPLTLLAYFTEQKQLPRALEFAEWRLRLAPEDDAFLNSYLSTALQAKQQERLEKFLDSGLASRPVRIQWHRAYQGIARRDGREPALVARYRSELEREPTNSALMYLLGRVVPTRLESRQWFERACTADTNNAFAYYARAYDQISSGNWEAARGLLAHACAVRPQHREFKQQLDQVRFALEDYAALEKEYRAQLKAEPMNFVVAQSLCEVLVAQGDKSGATDFAKEFIKQARSQAPDSPRVPKASHELTCYVEYLAGDYDAMRKSCEGRNDEFHNYQKFILEMETGHPLAAVQAVPAESGEVENPFHFFHAAIGLRAAGQNEVAARWWELGLTRLDRGDADWQHAAAWLRSSTPTMAGLEEFVLPAAAKATLLTAAVQVHPELRSELLPLIKRLNRQPEFPHHLIDMAMARLP